jgi:hypothetical protein
MTTQARFLLDSLEDRSYPRVLVFLRESGNKHYEKVYYNRVTGEVVDIQVTLKSTIERQKCRYDKTLLDVKTQEDLREWAYASGSKPYTNIVNNLSDLSESNHHQEMIKLCSFIQWDNVCILSAQDIKWVFGNNPSRKIKQIESTGILKHWKVKGGRLFKVHPYYYCCGSTYNKEWLISGWCSVNHIDGLDKITNGCVGETMGDSPYEEVLSPYEPSNTYHSGARSNLLINKITDIDFSLFHHKQCTWKDVVNAYQNVKYNTQYSGKKSYIKEWEKYQNIPF